MGRRDRGGRLRVAQHQPDGIRLFLGRTHGLREAFGRLSFTGPRGIQRSLNGVGLTQDQRKEARRAGLGDRTRPSGYELSSTWAAWRGESIVDYTWANPAASRRLSVWGVSPEETCWEHDTFTLYT